MYEKMEDRIRFGSDGNGIFVCVMARGWEVFKSSDVERERFEQWLREGRLKIAAEDVAMAREWLNPESTWQGPGFPMPKRDTASLVAAVADHNRRFKTVTCAGCNNAPVEVPIDSTEPARCAMCVLGDDSPARHRTAKREDG